MDIWVLNRNFESILVVDSYRSLIWTERYYEAGDFEIYFELTPEIAKAVVIDNYVWLNDSDQVMIIEKIQCTTDVDDGISLIASGRSLESILDRRVIWVQTRISGKLQNGVKKLLEENIIRPTFSNRRIDNFTFVETLDETIVEMKVDNQYTGDNLYEVVVTLCKERGIGFRVKLVPDELKRFWHFEFSLYAGTDRTYDQTNHPYVIFSPNFENIISSNYLVDMAGYKNCTLVLGEDDGKTRKRRVVGYQADGSIGLDVAATGLDRRELYTDARDLQSEQGVDEPDLTADEYNALLDARGSEKLLEWPYVKTFDGQVDSSRLFVYGRDFFKGDIVQIETETGVEATARITEVIHSQDSSGYSITPTFEIMEE